MDTTQLVFSVLWSALGLGYFVYGKRQRSAVPLVCGLGLMLFPYFVENWIVLLGVALVLSIVPFVIR
jgi:hypothetical protein